HHRTLGGVACGADPDPAGVPVPVADRGLVRRQRQRLRRKCGISPADTGGPAAEDRGVRQSIGRTAVIMYAGIAYAAFVVAAVWAIAFLAGTVDGPARRPVWSALLVDAGLLLVFAVQHSVMARTGVKRRLARIVPGPAERSTY